MDESKVLSMENGTFEKEIILNEFLTQSDKIRLPFNNFLTQQDTVRDV